MNAAVTGASRGIGRATALLLAEAGYRVFALARSDADLHTLTHETSAAGRITPIVMDVADDRSRGEAVEAIQSATEGYGVDVLINNAGYGQLGPVEEVPVDRLRLQFETNVFGLVGLTQAFLPAMRERRQGSIVNVSSAAGRIAVPFMGPYCASKFALEAISDSLRVELAPFGVHVVLIEPGPIPTQFGETANREAVVTEGSAYAPYAYRTIASNVASNPFPRSAESVARTIVKAVRSSHPRARYTITPAAKLATLARLLPDRLVDAALLRFMGA